MFAIDRTEIAVHRRDSPSKLFNSLRRSQDVPSAILSMGPTSLETPTHSLTKDGQTTRDCQASLTSQHLLTVENHEWHASSSSSPNFSRNITRSRSFNLFQSSKSRSSLNTHSTVSTGTLTKSPSHSLLLNLLVQPQLANAGCPEAAPIPSEYPMEDCSHAQQRQVELDRVVRQLMSMIERKTNENLHQICNAWRTLKYSASSQVTPRSLFVDYLFKSIYARSSLPFAVEHNDDIHAAFQVLSTTLTIIKAKSPSINIASFFDDVEKQTQEQIHERLASLLSSYTDEHQLITESIRFYQSSSKTTDWIRIIRTDYPPLIERISNDFNSRVPSIEQTLLQMLFDVKTQLLRVHSE